MDIPKIFWAFYDLFRRKKIDIAEFSQRSNLSKEEIELYLKEISKKVIKHANIIINALSFFV